jgi:hypothetical protein
MLYLRGVIGKGVIGSLLKLVPYGSQQEFDFYPSVGGIPSQAQTPSARYLWGRAEKLLPNSQGYWVRELSALGGLRVEKLVTHFKFGGSFFDIYLKK